MAEIIVFLEPEKWQPNGIRHRQCSLSAGSSDNEIEVLLCPSGFDCSKEEVEVYILPEGRSEIDCLLCYSVEEVPFKSSILRINNELLSLHNQAREEFCSGCPPLKLDESLIRLAQWFAEDMKNFDYYHSDHTDRFGRGVAERFLLFGIDYIEGGENIGWVASDALTEREAIQTMFSGWMNSPHHRENILNSNFKQVGFGIASKEVEIDGKLLTKWWFVADFGNLRSKKPVTPDPELPCTSECMKEIRWYQKSEKVKEWDYSGEEPQVVERVRPLPELVFEIPYINMCGIEKMELWGEVSGTLANIEFHGKGQATDRLEFIWEPYRRPLVIDFTETRPFPGELILLLVYMRGYSGNCNPWIAGYTWFETFCFTSGEILSCCLVDDDGNITDESSELPDSWIGQDNLRYKVRFKGNQVYLLKCSDYAKYRESERCIIFKNGSFRMKDTEKDSCRAGQFEPVGSGQVLSDSVVSYSLDPKKDIVVPVWFWSEGA